MESLQYRTDPAPSNVRSKPKHKTRKQLSWRTLPTLPTACPKFAQRNSQLRGPRNKIGEAIISANSSV